MGSSIMDEFRQTYQQYLRNSGYEVFEVHPGRFCIRSMYGGLDDRVYEKNEELSNKLSRHLGVEIGVVRLKEREKETNNILVITRNPYGIEMSVFLFVPEKGELLCSEQTFDRNGYQKCRTGYGNAKLRKKAQNAYIQAIKETNEYRLYETTGSLHIRYS